MIIAQDEAESIREPNNFLHRVKLVKKSDMDWSIVQNFQKIIYHRNCHADLLLFIASFSRISFTWCLQSLIPEKFFVSTYTILISIINKEGVFWRPKVV